jgi:hypothetical protein
VDKDDEMMTELLMQEDAKAAADKEGADHGLGRSSILQRVAQHRSP